MPTEQLVMEWAIDDTPKRAPPDFSQCFQFDPEQRTAEAAAARRAVSPYRLGSSYVADLNGYRVTQDMLRHPIGPKFRELLKEGDVVRTNYGTGPYIVDHIGKYPAYGVDCYSLGLEDLNGKHGYGINELVAIDGRLLHLFLANEDEVEVMKDYKLPEKPQLTMQLDFEEEEEEEFDDE